MTAVVAQRQRTTLELFEACARRELSPEEAATLLMVRDRRRELHHLRWQTLGVVALVLWGLTLKQGCNWPWEMAR